MRNSVKRKLKSNEGASLMVALLFFVVCVAVGSIILTAATAASGRMTGIKKTNQDFYALKSAAKLFKKDWTYGVATLYVKDGSVMLVDPEVNMGESSAYLVGFIESRDYLAKSVYSSKDDAPYTKTYYVEAPNLSKVKAEVSMKDNYDTVMIFTIDDEADENATGGVVTLTFDGSTDEFEDEGITKTKVSWSNPQISTGGGFK